MKQLYGSCKSKLLVTLSLKAMLIIIRNLRTSHIHDVPREIVATWATTGAAQFATTFLGACIRLCLRSELLSVNVFSHSTHLYVLPVCVTRCLLRPEAWQNAFGHSWQWCNCMSFGFNFWWRRICTLSASRCVKLLSQCWHWNGFWPECVIKWRNRISFCANARWQMLHPNGFSPANVTNEKFNFK